ncbi:MAG: hypothetical protein COW88_03455 [Candidatus Lloydbacteria bacterium CG22_combo_CG10-13_8_21_14_all_47_15]|uniref:Uncharacterized protein n=1 Tax=Candidatus Lloydbacteria bacterium CG22_combo_CG10-13_8_21_14_all_47_15 TaxID=1974635 RepID=A0A2H0CTF3_9BACT|nr:MAG: hypothetical protein COW88_03455 [Candidatus Lloydbacteria bacterium CG22_combo_CG10-13_8_21_14_all_47_15]
MVLWGAIIAVLWISLSTIFGELLQPFKDFLAVTFTHHWIGKSIITVAIVFLFFCAAWMFRRTDMQTIPRGLVWLLFWVSLCGVIAIIIFFALHAF